MIITGNAADVAAAYVKARSEMDTALAQNGKGVYGKYMELVDILKMVAPILAQNGLVVNQEPMATDEGVGVATTILHASGARIEFVPFIIPLTKREPHAAGSALSYAKRYALAAVFGLAGDDDDGQAAQDSFKAKGTKPAAQPTSYQDDEMWDTPASHSKQPDTLSPAQLQRIHILGKQVHGADWPAVGPKRVENASKGAVTSSKELTREEAAIVIKELEVELKANGNPQGAARNGKVAA